MRKSVSVECCSPISKIRSRALVGTALCALFASYAPAFAAELEEIVVTAEKRSDTTRNLSREIQAFSEDRMKDSGVTDAQTLQALVPGLNFGNQGASSRIYLRGIGTLLAGNGLDSTVATYIDDRYVSTNQGALGLDFLDVNHVEVLKGPQGTLFGRNAAAGAIRVLTNDVSRDFEGSVKGTVGNYDAWGLQGTVNIPVNDKLAVRLSALTSNHGPYNENLSPKGEHDWGDKDLQEFRGKIRWDITDRIRSDLTLAYWQKSDLEADGSVIPPGATGARAVTDPTHPIYSTKQGYVGSDIHGFRNDGHEFSGQWHLNIQTEPFDIVSVSTGSIYKFGQTTDADASDLQYLNLIRAYQTIQDFSQEVRLQSNKSDSKFKWVAGLYYYKGTNTWASYLNTFIGPLTTGRQILRTEAFAAFGDVTYSFTPQWSVVLGGRWNRESKAVLFNGVPPYDNAALDKADDKRWYSFTPEASLQFKPSFGMLYLTYSEGFKSGGFSYPYDPAGTVSPEHLKSFVVGYKGELADRHLSLDVAAFHYDYTNMQVSVASTQFALPLTQNAGSSTINGVELEGRWVATSWLNLTAGGSWTDGHYDKFPAAAATANAPGYPSAIIDAAGRQLLWLSEWSYYVQAAADLPIGAGNIHSQLTWNWKSDFDFLFADVKSAGLSFLTQKGYGLLNGRVSYTPPVGNWEVGLWANNLLDQDYFTTLQGAGGSITAQYGAPQTFGADFSYKF